MMIVSEAASREGMRVRMNFVLLYRMYRLCAWSAETRFRSRNQNK